MVVKMMNIFMLIIGISLDVIGIWYWVEWDTLSVILITVGGILVGSSIRNMKQKKR
jgi:hypothetical protein